MSESYILDMGTSNTHLVVDTNKGITQATLYNNSPISLEIVNISVLAQWGGSKTKVP